MPLSKVVTELVLTVKPSGSLSVAGTHCTIKVRGRMLQYVTREITGSTDCYVTALTRACQSTNTSYGVCGSLGSTANDHGRKLVAKLVEMLVGVSVA